MSLCVVSLETWAPLSPLSLHGFVAESAGVIRELPMNVNE